jgi:hypothetical protein
MRETVFEHEQITVYFHPEHGIVHHEIHEAPRGQPFRDALNRGAEMFETRGATKWLSDDRHFYVLPKEDEEWGTTVWFPRMKAAGWLYWAVVKPEKAVAQLNVSRFVQSFADMGITATMVTNFDEAWGWLVEAGK